MSWEYDNYLFEHIENVKKGFRWMCDNLPDIIIDEFEFSNINYHDWQYWVLINDDPEEGTIALDMPYEYIVEMICDWWSFSWKTGNLYGVFDWYDEHKERMILSTKTRTTVEDILNKIKEVLDESSRNESV